MSELNTQEIRERADRATPGPWKVGRATVGFVVDGVEIEICGTDNGHCRENTDAANVAFIAAARTDVPALCDEMERLREAYNKLFQMHNEKWTGGLNEPH